MPKSYQHLLCSEYSTQTQRVLFLLLHFCLDSTASFGELDIIGSLEVINNSGSFDLGSTLEVRGVVEVVERYGKDYMVRGRINPTASDEVIKTMVDLMVKNDYLKHRLVGMKGELLDA